MPSLENYLGGGRPFGEWTSIFDNTESVEQRIKERPSEIIIRRSTSTTLDAQTVRIEAEGFPGQSRGENAVISLSSVIILGYKNHPDIDDTDIGRGDRFHYGGSNYEVVEVTVNFQDRVMARARVTG
jgi:hypothetical protein